MNAASPDVGASASRSTVRWPDGKRFAFTVFDDTDAATVENVGPVYSLLADYGLRTTKSVWPSASTRHPINGGATCQDPDYRQWLLQLQRDGFEIGYHLDRSHTAYREETAAGLDTFRDIFGHDPRTMANHTGCRNCIYWGAERLHGFNRTVYNFSTRFRNRDRFRGHIEEDETFWGDLCRDRIHYVRGFVFHEINTLRRCPLMPYRDPDTPYVNSWFSSSEGAQRSSYLERLSEANQDRLEEEGGACIMYTHFAFGFVQGGRVDARFQSLMKRLSQKNGWFVPVSTLLDYLNAQGRGGTISPLERRRLERAWLRQRLLHGTS